MNIRRFFTVKKIIIYAILLLVIGGISFKIYKSRNNTDNILVDTARLQDLKQTVLATGQVNSITDLSLSFKTSGVVDSIGVKVGDKVKKGQTLANLSQRDQIAIYTSTRGALASAQANYNKILAGASNEDIAVSQKTVDSAKISLENTKAQQAVAVKNALSAYLNTGLSAELSNGGISSVTVAVSGTYVGTELGKYMLKVYSSSGGYRLSVFGIEDSDVGLSTVSTYVPVGIKGLFVQFNSFNFNGSESWIINIPNLKAANYVTYYNAYQAALETQKTSVDAAQAAYDQAVVNLNLKKAQARPVDLAVYEAQIISAEGQVQAALASLENTIIRAPSTGTITSVDIKVGELATAFKEAVVLQDVDRLHIEANISEANVAIIKPGQFIDVTYDSLGPDNKYVSTVEFVDPASTVISGVVNYKITTSLDNPNAEIKPGMTANLTVLTGEKKNVLAISQRAIVIKDNKKFVRVITDSKKKIYKETVVTTGLEADGGLVEILSGLEENQEVVSYIKPK